MGITATLEAIDRNENGWEMTENQQTVANGSKKHERWAAQGMFALFLAAVISMIVAGFSAAG
jgi:hypothetical protein